MIGAGLDAVAVRPMTEADAGGYLACVGRVARERRHITVVDTPPEAPARAHVADLVARDLPAYVAATETGDIVGWCIVFVPKHGPERPGFDHVGALNIGLDAAHRGRGLGHRLMAAALAHADRLGLERVELQVFSDNPAALALYRRLGFVEEGVKRRARKLDGRIDDLVLMARIRA